MPTESNAFDYQTYLKNAPEQPGIYKMLDGNADVLYVGKAKNLKKTAVQLFPQAGPGGQDSGHGRQDSGH